MNVSTAPGIVFSNSNPWHGGNSLRVGRGGDLSVIAVLGFLTMLGDLSLNRHFGARAQFFSEHPNRRPSPDFLDMWEPRFQHAWHCLFMMWNHSFGYEQAKCDTCYVSNGAGVLMTLVVLWLSGPRDVILRKVNVLGSESSQCSGHSGGRQRGRVSSSRTCSLPHWCCLMVGCVCSQLGPKLWILDSSQVALIYLAFILLLWSWFPSHWHGSSHSLWAL